MRKKLHDKILVKCRTPWRIGSVLAFHALIPSSILGAALSSLGSENPTAGVRDGPCNPSYWEAERGQWMLSKMLGAPSRVCTLLPKRREVTRWTKSKQRHLESAAAKNSVR